jgi:hypothetical protein
MFLQCALLKKSGERLDSPPRSTRALESKRIGLMCIFSMYNVYEIPVRMLVHATFLSSSV